MDNKTKILLGATIAGLGLWWWFSQGSANASLAAHIPATPIPTPGPAATADQVQPPALTLTGGSVAVSPVQAAVTANGQMTAACIAWAQQTKNPALYVQMINQLSASDLAGLYNLVTTYWAGTTKQPTAAQTAFWNYLRGEYPFLNTGGAGCVNFACN